MQTDFPFTTGKSEYQLYYIENICQYFFIKTALPNNIIWHHMALFAYIWKIGTANATSRDKFIKIC